GGGNFGIDAQGVIDLSAFGLTSQANSLIVGDYENGDGTFGPPDGFDDVGVISPNLGDFGAPFTDGIIAFLSDGTGLSFNVAVSGIEFPTLDTTFISATSADVDNNGFDDIILGRGTSAEYTVILNNGDTTYTTVNKTFSNGLNNVRLAPKIVDV